MKIKTKHVLLIAGLAALTFSNTLWNGFVGDDSVLFVDNSFYRSWENFPRLFESSYSSSSETVFNRMRKDLGSGSVAYRPVLSTTYFIDSWLWGQKPFGFHLTNLGIHVLNCILLYIVLLRILPNASLSLLAALIFAAHPLKSEAVAAIGYRADLLSTLFVLAAFRLYISASNGRGLLRWTGVCAFFILGLFSKETAAVFPFLCLSYDYFVKNESVKTVARHSGRYAAFFSILAVYIYLYVFVFTNQAVVFEYMEGSLFHHVLVMIEIFSGYLINAFIPFTVKSLPPVYHPPLTLYYGLAPIFSTAVLVGSFLGCALIFRKSRILSFSVLWFLLTFLPVSNIIPVPNPMAYRFMYLPSVGLSIMLAYLIERICSLPKLRSEARAGFMIRNGLVVCMMIYTFLLNFAWKSNYTMAANMVRDFPYDGQGHLFLGMEYCKTMEIEKAQEELRKAYEAGVDDPRLLYTMAFCRKSGNKEAERLYKISIQRYPAYLLSYIGLARIYLFEKKYDEALKLLRVVIDGGGNYSAYGYAIQAYMIKGEKDKARGLLEKAKKTMTEKGHIESLKRMLASNPGIFPVDIGI